MLLGKWKVSRKRVKTLCGRKWGIFVMMLGGMWNEGRMKERKLEGRWEVCRWFRFAQLAKGKKFRP
jgi:hypothetical protein